MSIATLIQSLRQFDRQEYSMSFDVASSLRSLHYSLEVERAQIFQASSPWLWQFSSLGPGRAQARFLNSSLEPRISSFKPLFGPIFYNLKIYDFDIFWEIMVLPIPNKKPNQIFMTLFKKALKKIFEQIFFLYFVQQFCTNLTFEYSRAFISSSGRARAWARLRISSFKPEKAW